MTKQEIIIELEKCLNDFEKGFNLIKKTEVSVHFEIASNLRIARGFCFYFDSYSNSQFVLLMIQLEKELTFEKDDFFYWYPTFKDSFDLQKSILPRIKHLKRTISRLKNEIQNDANN